MFNVAPIVLWGSVFDPCFVMLILSIFTIILMRLRERGREREIERESELGALF